MFYLVQRICRRLLPIALFYHLISMDSAFNRSIKYPILPQLSTDFILILMVLIDNKHQRSIKPSPWLFSSKCYKPRLLILIKLVLSQQMALQSVQHPLLPSPHPQQLLEKVWFFCSLLFSASCLNIGVNKVSHTTGPSNFPVLGFQKWSVNPAAHKKATFPLAFLKSPYQLQTTGHREGENALLSHQKSAVLASRCFDYLFLFAGFGLFFCFCGFFF